MEQQNLYEMLTLQQSMNSKVNPNWQSAGYNWMLAAMIEGVEGIDHHGWKWWKKQTPDMPQLQMELVDIWHFALSHMLLQNEELSIEELAKNIHDEIMMPIEIVHLGSFRSVNISDTDLLTQMQFLAGMNAFNEFSISLFGAILKNAKMNWDDLYSQYIGKNVLNFFRQDHGYKEGTYTKIWGGIEDNAHLTELLATSKNEPDLAKFLYSALNDRYKNLVSH